MFGSDDDNFDSHCYSCGVGYFFDVGFDLGICPKCGGPKDKPRQTPTVTHTDLRQKLVNGIKERKEWIELAEKAIEKFDNGGRWEDLIF